VWSWRQHTRLQALDLSGNALGTEGLIYFLPALTIGTPPPAPEGKPGRASPAKHPPPGGSRGEERASAMTHIGLESNGLCWASLAALAKVLPALGRLEVLALADNRLRFGARSTGGGGGDDASGAMAAEEEFVSKLVQHCRALRYVDVLHVDRAVQRAAPPTPCPTHPHHHQQPGATGGDARTPGWERPWWQPDFVAAAYAPLTLGAALWATEVLEQWRSQLLSTTSSAADYDAREELEEWREEAVRVLTRLLAPPRVPRADLTGVIAASKLGRAVSRCAALMRRSDERPGGVSGGGGGRGGGPARVVSLLAALVKAKWEAALE